MPRDPLDVVRYNDALQITMRWFSPKAYFFLFFTLFWNVFLLFWYSMVFIGDAPLLFLLFPLLHVAVGVGMAYYTLCLFLNRTHVDVDQRQISIRHQPIPWWRGNKHYDPQDINQLYVKEKVAYTKNRQPHYAYELRAKLKDGRDQSIISINQSSSTAMQEVESYIEEFLGINDRPVKGEYGKRNNNPQPRRQRRDFSDDPLEEVFASTLHQNFELQGQLLEVISLTQYDWHNGNSDKQLQVVNTNNEEQLVYIEQNKARWRASRESSMNYAELRSLNIDPKQPANTLSWNGIQYHLQDHRVGSSFMTAVNNPIKVEQWLYLSEDKQRHLRLLNHDGQLSIHLGERLKSDDFNKRLNLNAPPPNPEAQPRWDDEDFV